MERLPSAPLAAYHQVLELRDERSRPFIIVGGQAVNYWAARFVSMEPRLAAHRPFTSKDLDLLVSNEQVARIAAVLSDDGWTFVEPDPEAEAVLGRLRNGDLLLELLAPGPRPILPATQTELPGGDTPLLIRVNDPLLLLDSKVDLALRIPQDGSLPGIEKRRDAEHVRMLSLLMPHYLRSTTDNCLDDQTRASRLQPAVAILASIRRYSGAKFDAAYPGVCDWAELVPPDLRALPFNDPHRRALGELTATP